MKYPPGDFSFIDDLHERALFLDAFTAITLTESWQLMRDGPGSAGYMFTNPDGMKKVEAAMKHMDSHSGGSYACVMRDMEFIAKHGWNKYVADNITAITQRHAEAAIKAANDARASATIAENATFAHVMADLWVKNAIEPFAKGYIPNDTSSDFTKNAYALYLGIKNKENVDKLMKLNETLKATPLSYNEMRSYFG